MTKAPTHVKAMARKTATSYQDLRCIKGIRVEIIRSLLIIVQEISFDRRLFYC